MSESVPIPQSKFPKRKFLDLVEIWVRSHFSPVHHTHWRRRPDSLGYPVLASGRWRVPLQTARFLPSNWASHRCRWSQWHDRPRKGSCNYQKATPQAWSCRCFHLGLGSLLVRTNQHPKHGVLTKEDHFGGQLRYIMFLVVYFILKQCCCLIYFYMQRTLCIVSDPTSSLCFSRDSCLSPIGESLTLQISFVWHLCAGLLVATLCKSEVRLLNVLRVINVLLHEAPLNGCIFVSPLNRCMKTGFA